VRVNFNFRKYFSWVIVVFFCIFFSLVFNIIDIFSPIENIFYDLRFKIRGPKKPSDKIVIVKIDEESLAELGRWPWNRKVVAKIVENLVSSGAEIVALDIIFPEKSVPESDNKLAAALAKGKTVVAAHFETMYENVLKGDAVKKVLVEKLILPIPQIQKVAKIGFANVEPDKDGVVRNMVLYKNYEDKIIYSFNFVVVKEYIDNMSIISTVPQKIYINYYGPSEYYDKKADRIISTFVGYSAVNIYRNVIPPAWLKDKIVLIGSTATGAYDHYPTPYIHTYPGVELHATVIENILSHTYCKKFNKGYLLLISAAVGIILGIVFYNLAVLPTISLIFIFVIGYYLLTYFIFIKFYTIIDFVPVALNIVLVGVSNLSYKLFFEQREKKLIKKVFSKYINPYIMERLLEDPAGSLSVLGGQKREITVAFADIRGFTTIAEHLAAEEVVKFLNECFSMLSNIIFKYNGTIDKYIGDCIMFFWNAPVEQPDHPYLAVKCVIEMFYELNKLNQIYQFPFGFKIRMGAGINTGEAVVGNIGSAQLMEYTVVGDTVNVASRLQELTKEFNVPIIISEYVNEKVKDRISTIPLGKVILRGRKQEIEIFGIKI